jgi:S1-C subfamily serine protease
MSPQTRTKDWILPIAIGLVVGLVILLYQYWQKPISSESELTLKTSYADIIEPVLPFTVSILSNRNSDQNISALAEDPYFSKFIKPGPRQQTSLGSGIIINRQGTVVTNAHVIKEANEIIILTNDGDLVQVNRVLIDPETDIAVLDTNLQISADLPFEMSGEDRVGDLVFTIGNPFGIGQSVSMGVISATGRQQPGLTQLTDFIQTDAAINPGNSGGALINANGKVIGMNTAIFSSTGGSQGIGFAIPFMHVLSVAQELARNGKVTRGYLGIDVAELTPAELGDLKVTATALKVTSIAPGSPAALAGLMVGDTLLEINNTPIQSRIQATRIISQLMPGKRTSILIKRGDERIELEVTLSVKN